MYGFMQNTSPYWSKYNQPEISVPSIMFTLKCGKCLELLEKLWCVCEIFFLTKILFQRPLQLLQYTSFLGNRWALCIAFISYLNQQVNFFNKHLLSTHYVLNTGFTKMSKDIVPVFKELKVRLNSISFTRRILMKVSEWGLKII